MRVTQSMLTDTATLYLMRDLDQLQRVQQKIATGRNYQLPSEAPVETTQIVHVAAKKAEAEQYRKALDTGMAWTEMTSRVLTQVEDLLSEILDVSQGASSRAATSAEREQAARTINSLAEELVMLANRQYRGKYLFGGDETLTAPFTAGYGADGVTLTGVTANPNGIDGQWGFLVSDVDTVTINTPGSEVFQPNGEGSNDDIFVILQDLRYAHQTQNFDALAIEEGRLHDAILRVSAVNSNVGSKTQTLESLAADLDTVVLSYEAERSKLEDTDLAEAIVDYNVAGNIYQAALSSTARILQFSLADFI
jgi:flagellar hook-associated protein 3 FlgL